MKLTITQEDIDKGHQFRNDSCPVALALIRKTGCEMVSVLENNTIIWRSEHARLKRFRELGRRYTHSVEVVNFINSFDKGKPVEPTTVVLYSSR